MLSVCVQYLPFEHHEPLYRAIEARRVVSCFPMHRTIRERARLEDILGLTMHSFIEAMHAYKPVAAAPLDLEPATGSNFATYDLTFRSLLCFGDIRLKWTTCLEDHLKLNVVDKTLLVAWSIYPVYHPETANEAIEASYMAMWEDRCVGTAAPIRKFLTRYLV